MHFAVHLLLIATAAVAVAVAVASNVCYALEHDQHEPGPSKLVDAGDRLTAMPMLFNFNYFKQSFNKAYGSTVEELARKALFMARAFRVFVSGVAYKFRRSGHYLAVNFMSDLTPSERAAMRNKVIARRASGTPSRPARAEAHKRSAQAGTLNDKQLMASATIDPGPLERLIESDIKQVLASGAAVEYASLLGEIDPIVSGRARVRRRRNALGPRGPRNFSSSLLIKLPAINYANPTQKPTRGPGGVRTRVRVSGNEQHEIVLPSRRLIDQQEPINKWTIGPLEARSLFSSFKSTLGYFLGQSKKDESGKRVVDKNDKKIKLTNPNPNLNLNPNDDDDDNNRQEDKLFFDHRQSNCLFTPRYQGLCGSCYAFASIALIEWMHCIKTGNLIAFSEQFMIDCGNMRVDGDALLGCDGAYMDSVGKFLHNFGLELRANYPYKAKLETCPYDDSTNLTTIGHIRMQLANLVEVPRERWDEYIQYSPLVISLATPADFIQYGGGVDSGARCSHEPDHSMLLVGHGREDGQQYWLIRNSYSPGWGDMGYYKLSKRAPKRCIEGNIGQAYGSSDGKIYDVKPSENLLNDKTLVQRRYSQALNNEVVW